ncbi:MAG: hypothetical protein U9Q27_01455 [Patescibacteria group bacterium]|nr:hypothetical protein [Patescibacteria group bacterium]
MGNFWGGGQGGYKTKSLQADTKKELINKAKTMLNDGSLDAGMGFESLTGARLNIIKISTIVQEGKELINEEIYPVVIGENLTKEEKDFLLYDCDNF